MLFVWSVELLSNLLWVVLNKEEVCEGTDLWKVVEIIEKFLSSEIMRENYRKVLFTTLVNDNEDFFPNNII